METITLKVNDNVFDKFQWLINHFSKNEIDIVNDIDRSKLSPKDFDYISNEQMDKLQQISQDFKQGNKEDFEEYAI
ncbi:MAG: hypothetical protein OIF32_04300 [Campylobacterales bacterium]|nr:hypothetical protein [Campylobacterales bacterium]